MSFIGFGVVSGDVGLTEKLAKSSRDVDEILADLARVTRDRSSAVKQLEFNLVALEGTSSSLP